MFIRQSIREPLTLTTLSSPFVSLGGVQETKDQGAGVVSIARNFLTRPPTGTPRRAINPGEGLLIP